METSLTTELKKAAEIANLAIPDLLIFDYRFKDICDISPLKQLSKVKHLDLIGNKITNISALAHLADLESLTLTYNPISDFSHLRDLPKLEQLDLQDCQLGNIAVLEEFKALKRLYLGGNTNIVDLSPLQNMANLEGWILESFHKLMISHLCKKWSTWKVSYFIEIK